MKNLTAYFARLDDLAPVNMNDAIACLVEVFGLKLWVANDVVLAWWKRSAR